MALPHHNRACLCNLFLKVDWIKGMASAVRQGWTDEGF